MQTLYLNQMRINGLQIKRFREENEITQKELGKMLGISYKTILNYENGKVIPETKIEILERLLNSYGKNKTPNPIMDIESESGKQVGEAKQITISEPNAIYVGAYIKEQLVKVPMLDINARAGFVDNLENYSEYITEYTYVVPQKGERYENSLAIKIDGDSMEPRLERGDTILAMKEEKSEWEYLNPGVYAVVYRKTFAIKRIKKNTLQAKGEVEFFSDNEMHGSVAVKYEDIKAIWKVVRIIDRRVY